MGLRTNKLAALVEELHLVQVGWDVVEASLALRADSCPIIGLCSVLCQKANEEDNHHEKNPIGKYWAVRVVEVGLWHAVKFILESGKGQSYNPYKKPNLI